MSVILLLDDEKVILDLVTTTLTAAGFKVLTTSGADEAIGTAASHQGDISLFITDHRLSCGSSGREVAEKILQTRPTTPVLHISGYPEEDLRLEGSFTPGGFYLGKPFLPKELVAKVKKIVGRPSPNSSATGEGSN
jgi:DNA-binding response OmpR family regulator